MNINHEIIYINNDYTVATVVGCNGFGFLGRSDVMVLARDYHEYEENIQNALDEAAYIGFDVSDAVSTDVSYCSEFEEDII